MKANTIHDLYVQQLKDIYSAERQLVQALPKMAKAASNVELRDAFESHLAETKVHVERIEMIFEKLEAKPGGHKCKAMEGLIEEGDEMMKEEGNPDVIDAGLIAAAQRVEHYEIAAYGCARTFAELLGEAEAVQTLQQTLDEESSADTKLTDVAKNVVHPKAKAVLTA